MNEALIHGGLANRVKVNIHWIDAELFEQPVDGARIFQHENGLGTAGDGGRTLEVLHTDHGFAAGALDLLFIDHDKNAYLTDLLSITERGLLRAPFEESLKAMELAQ